MSDVERIKKKLLKKLESSPIVPTDYLSTGCTLLNLELSGNPNQGFLKGKYYLFVGDSASGKTWEALTCFAEASISSCFADYKFIYNNAEDGALMDFARYFGSNMSSRIEQRCSSTVEEFYYDVDDVIQEKKPFIYVLDSMDALQTEDDEEQFSKKKKAHQAGKKDVGGSYGTAKAKANSQGLRVLVDNLKKSGSILIIIAQTRMNIGFGAQYNPKTRSGGTSLKFYATNELWFSIKEKLTKRARGKERHVGSLVQIQIKKNRQSGRECKIEIPIYHSSGLDDLGSLVDYLIDEEYWKGTDKTVVASDFDFSGKKEDFIAKIEEDNQENVLKSIVTDLWQEIEKESRVQRKSKYG